MLDKQRQRNISKPASIFRDLRAKSQMRERREVLKPLVPKVHDEDIVELCKKYKVKATEEDTAKSQIKGNQLQMYNLRQEIKQKQNNLIHNVEKELKKGEKTRFNLFFE